MEYLRSLCQVLFGSRGLWICAPTVA